MGRFDNLKIKFFSNKVLPTVYDDALSYYEVLNKVTDHLNDTVDTVESMQEQVDSASASAAQANENAQSAISIANDAKGIAQDANGLANGATLTAQQALDRANSAYTLAETADGNATSAIADASDAVTYSQRAIGTSNSALSTAQQAVNTANMALAQTMGAGVVKCKLVDGQNAGSIVIDSSYTETMQTLVAQIKTGNIMFQYGDDSNMIYGGTVQAFPCRTNTREVVSTGGSITQFDCEIIFTHFSEVILPSRQDVIAVNKVLLSFRVPDNNINTTTFISGTISDYSISFL